MQRLVSITLASLFTWMLVLSAYAPVDSKTLPACCRKSGAHHCTMQSQAQSDDSGFVSGNPCPYQPMGGFFTGHFDGFAPSAASAIFAGLVSHPALVPQVNAAYRVSQIRLQLKRGPPSSLNT